jgi:hypothetical protein
MNYGVTKEGFVKKPFSELLANLENKLRSKLGPDTYLAPETELGQISAIFVDQVADLWDLQEAVSPLYPVMKFIFIALNW